MAVGTRVIGGQVFVDKETISPEGYLVLMFLLNTAKEAQYGISMKGLVQDVSKVLSPDEVDLAIDAVADKYLVQFWVEGGKPVYLERQKDGYIGLTLAGMAVLVNYAGEYLEKINHKFGEIPENLTATLVPFLDLTKVPAADRYVSTADNLPAFQTLAESLEAIRLEILRDQNRNDLPISQKRATIAEIDGFLAQIKGGFVKLSDLTSRIRPMVKNLAETCKDFTIIAGAASAAYLAIAQILGKLF